MSIVRSFSDAEVQPNGLRVNVVPLILLYFAFQAAFIAFISNGAGLDDAEQLSYIGDFEWGYGGSQPPLYTWILTAVAAVLGTNFLTLQLVKFTLLASMFLSVYAGARLLGLPSIVAATGMLGMFLLPQIAWESQRALTHSVAGTAGCAWAFLAFAWHMRSRGWASAALLGLTMALALLGKFNAGFFVGGLVLATMTIPAYRPVLFSSKSIVTLAAFAVTLTPPVLWMLNNSESVFSRVHKFGVEASGNVLVNRVIGVADAVQAAVFFLLLALVVFGVGLWRSRRDKVGAPAPASDGELLVQRIALFGLVLVAAAVVISGTTIVKDRWFQPVLFLAPLALAAWVSRFRSTAAPLRRIAIAGGLVALLVIPALAVNLTYGSLRKPPLGQLDYERLHAETVALGSFSTAISDRPQLVGNLKLFDPLLQPVHAEMPNALSRITRPALVIWTGKKMPESLARMLEAADIELSPQDVRRTSIPYRYRPEITMPVNYAIVG